MHVLDWLVGKRKYLLGCQRYSFKVPRVLRLPLRWQSPEQTVGFW
jgi:hypothetical protein